MARSVKALKVSAMPAHRSYLTFDVAAADVERATLRLFAEQAAGTIRVRVATGARGPAAAGPSVRAVPSERAWVELDVTRLVRGGGRVALMLEAERGGAQFTGSMALANPPHLVLRRSSGASSDQPSFPIRAAFYYPWYAGEWRGYSKIEPGLGSYQSGDPGAIRRHVLSMMYGGLDAGISSWWGPGDFTDRNLETILDVTAETAFRWAVYYERESTGNPSAAELREHLQHLAVQLDHPAALRIDGRFVVFVYRDGRDGCDMAARWKEAARGTEAYVVLYSFVGFRSCAAQPDAWHAYDPSMPEASQGLSAFEISPGFAPAKDTDPGRPLARDVDRWRGNVRAMLASNARFQLVTTFNEWWESSSIESSPQWESESGHGIFLDVMHEEIGAWREAHGEESPPLPDWSEEQLAVAPVPVEVPPTTGKPVPPPEPVEAPAAQPPAAQPPAQPSKQEEPKQPSEPAAPPSPPAAAPPKPSEPKPPSREREEREREREERQRERKEERREERKEEREERRRERQEREREKQPAPAAPAAPASPPAEQPTAPAQG